MLVTLSLPNVQFGHLLPREDALAYTDNAFVVADGVRRDPVGVMDFSDFSTEELLQYYPPGSGAALAAQLFCRRFLKALADPEIGNDVRQAFIAANRAIAELNAQLVKRPDYLVNDYCACVAATGVIEDNVLHWGFIGDSGIAIIDQSGKIRFRTPNGMEEFNRFAPKIGFDWNKPEGRQLVRSRYRNNPNQVVNGTCVSFGALTGESAAEHFMQFGTEGLDVGDWVLFYTNGLQNIIGRKELGDALTGKGDVKAGVASLLEQLAGADYDKFGKERTLIAVRHD